MDYKYLAKWVNECCHSADKNQHLADIIKWESQIALTFKNSPKYLHINLENDPFMFWGKVSQLSFFNGRRVNSYYDHLRSSYMTNIDICDSDRIIFLNFNKKDIYNELQRYTMVVELIPRRSNIILTKVIPDDHDSSPESSSVISKTMLIVDCWKTISLTDNTDRVILPQQLYKLPSTDGFSFDDVKFSYPLMLDTKGKIVSGMHTTNQKKGEELPEISAYYEMNELFSDLFYKIIIPEKQTRLIASKVKELRRKKQKLVKKLDRLNKELNEYCEASTDKIKAEIIKYNLHTIKTGMEKVNLINYYDDPPSEIEVELMTDKTALQNMNHYFKKYRKSLRGKEMKQAQILQTTEDVDDVEKTIFDLENNPAEVVLPLNHSKDNKLKTKKDSKTSKLRRILVNEDWEIFIGRTAKENDELSCKFAKPDDWWFHSRVYQGSHIIIRNYAKKQLPDELCLLCARLAAYYSRAKHSTNVPVDYTQIRFVTKPHKSPAGYVIYKNQKTIFANPLSLRDAVAKIESQNI